MKKTARILALILAILMLLGAFASSFAKAASWDNDVYAYGSGLNEEQIKKTAEILGVKDLDKVNKIIVDSEDLYRYLKENGSDQDMISSIYVQKTDKGSGVVIDVVSAENITKVTGEEYTNAALTAGVTDAKITVGAYTPVTGTSALTGVYKAFELNGVKLDEERIDVANEELETVNAIVTEHKDNEKFDTAKMNNIIVYIKDSLIQFKQENNNIASEDQIRKIVEEATNKYQLGDIITQNNINNLVVYFQNFQNSPAIDSKELQDQLKTFGEDLTKKADEFLKNANEKLGQGAKEAGETAKDAINKAKEYAQSDEAKGLFQKIMDFFKEVFTKISELFKG